MSILLVIGSIPSYIALIFLLTEVFSPGSHAGYVL
uniref:Uncharacterized protein n=1 Tax=Podoviridae sp. ct8Lf7 TaxID=2827723 RepID=A0A8S5S140_9CAUD|nr:MAG TPA: hypothetical protein [Podoviridae sp. ct8Lf7]